MQRSYFAILLNVAQIEISLDDRLQSFGVIETSSASDDA